MRKVTFLAAAAVILGGWAHAAAADFAPPPRGSACDTLSLRMVKILGGKGMRVKVNPFTERNDKLYFVIHEDAEKLLSAGSIEIGRLDAIDASNFNDLGGWVDSVGLEVILKEMENYGDTYGAWAVVVPNGPMYMVQVLFQIGPTKEQQCMVMTRDPLLLDGEALPAIYMQR